MDGKMFVKPAFEGAVLRFPDNAIVRLPEEGAWVPTDSYWTRRLNQGDVIAAQPEPNDDAE